MENDGEDDGGQRWQGRQQTEPHSLSWTAPPCSDNTRVLCAPGGLFTPVLQKGTLVFLQMDKMDA